MTTFPLNNFTKQVRGTLLNAVLAASLVALSVNAALAADWTNGTLNCTFELPSEIVEREAMPWPPFFLTYSIVSETSSYLKYICYSQTNEATASTTYTCSYNSDAKGTLYIKYKAPVTMPIDKSDTTSKSAPCNKLYQAGALTVKKNK